MKIGYIYDGYPEKRCIINMSKNEYKYYDLKRNIIYAAKSLLQKLGLMNYWDKQSCVNVSDKINVDIWHTFNQIPKTKKPYVITFETALPRNRETIERRWEWDELFLDRKLRKSRQQVQRLCQNNCIKLLAISSNAVDIMKLQLEKIGIGRLCLESIMDKMEVLYPPQRLNSSVEDISLKYEKDKCIKMVFVGNDYFRKGGVLLVEQLSKLNNPNVHLTIISSFHNDSISGFDSMKCQHHIDYIKSQSWISVHSNIPNDEVMKIIKDCHVGFLPTIQDTFGYSVLEMQASGVPVVTTDIRALSEINNSTCGWMISVTKHKVSKEAMYHDEEMLVNIYQEIKRGLSGVLKEILLKWDQGEYSYFYMKSVACLERIQELHDPVKYRERLTEIFKKCRNVKYEEKNKKIIL